MLKVSTNSFIKPIAKNISIISQHFKWGTENEEPGINCMADNFSCQESH